jgi:hypothetical protein
MVVLIVDKDSVLAFKFEGQTPVSAHIDRPVIFEFSGQPVEVPSRGIQVSGELCIIKGEQLQLQLTGVLRLDSCLRSGAKELLQAAMPEGSDHSV